jgi:hypothetical protein
MPIASPASNSLAGWFADRPTSAYARKVGWLFDIITDWLWIELVDRISQGKPWWVWALWACSPVMVVGLLFGAFWLSLR